MVRHRSSLIISPKRCQLLKTTFALFADIWSNLVFFHRSNLFGARWQMYAAKYSVIVALVSGLSPVRRHATWQSNAGLALRVPSHKSRMTSDKYPTMHNFVTEMCTHVYICVTKFCIVEYGTDAVWDLWDWFIAIPRARCIEILCEILTFSFRRHTLKMPSEYSSFCSGADVSPYKCKKLHNLVQGLMFYDTSLSDVMSSPLTGPQTSVSVHRNLLKCLCPIFKWFTMAKTVPV